MSGSILRSGAWPRPHRLIGRFLVTAALVLGGVHELGGRIVESLLPIYSHTIMIMDGRFAITDARVSGEGASEILRFRANFARPVVISGEELDPFGWAGRPEGGFQITYTVGGALQFGALFLIAILAWPAGSAREMAWRMGVAVPFGAILLLLDIPVTVVAELRNYLAMAVDPGSVSQWMVASRFLMGGGGAVMALVAALLAILAGRRLADSRRVACGAARWHSVSRREFDAFFRAYPRALEVCPPFDRPARHRTLRDRALGTGRESWVAEYRARGRRALYRIRSDLELAP